MKKLIFLSIFTVISILVSSQSYYWVYYTDKSGTEFNPYKYFDSKAIERRIKNGISLYDISDYPLNENYKTAISQFAIEVVGESRWLNATAIYADEISANYIAGFKFVKSVEKIDNDATLCSNSNDYKTASSTELTAVDKQLTRMKGDMFVTAGIDGKGIRIAVFDGGFPGVDTHGAFKHLRDNKQILKTWNFPKNQEDVYGWNSHGTMVLSCIAGISAADEKMGLATGSEFLLARTEVGAEPAKEEVWWMMAVEWADKNGADIINSSLGYGADRHRIKDMDGKTCVVTRAANMAASKGILVCNAMGNEGDDKTWKTLGAPADADSILSVGGIDPYYEDHISFSSYGPTADGRLKPNVCAYGEANVAKPDGYGVASGTSFSSPLVAGFAACAWQTHPDLSNMQMKSEIEKSGDVYPYYDYAIGYGVPQADYFLNDNINSAEKSFVISENEDYIIITPNQKDEKDKQKLYYHIRDISGMIEFYEHLEFYFNDNEDNFKITKSALDGGKTLCVFSNGYMETYQTGNLGEPIVITENPTDTYAHDVVLSIIPANEETSGFGVNSKYIIQPYFSFSKYLPPAPDGYTMRYMRSGSFNIGLRYKQNIAKWYSLGLNFEWGKTHVGLVDFTDWSSIYTATEYKAKEKFTAGYINLEFYQRFRLLPSGLLGFGLFWDTGVYGQWIAGASHDYKFETSSTLIESSSYYRDFESLQYGVRTRIGYGMLSIYGQYRISDLVLQNLYSMPRLEVGFELSIPVGL